MSGGNKFPETSQMSHFLCVITVTEGVTSPSCCIERCMILFFFNIINSLFVRQHSVECQENINDVSFSC